MVEHQAITDHAYYRAEKRENGKIVAVLGGRWNKKHDLQAWLAENWDYSDDYHPRHGLTLVVWKYSGAPAPARVIFNLKLPKDETYGA